MWTLLVVVMRAAEKEYVLAMMAKGSEVMAKGREVMAKGGEVMVKESEIVVRESYLDIYHLVSDGFSELLEYVDQFYHQIFPSVDHL